MNNFGEYVTVDQVLEMEKYDPAHTREELEAQARDNSMCQCGQSHVWRYGGCDLCFTCTTGEADASDDYELELVK